MAFHAWTLAVTVALFTVMLVVFPIAVLSDNVPSREPAASGRGAAPVLRAAARRPGAGVGRGGGGGEGGKAHEAALLPEEGGDAEGDGDQRHCGAPAHPGAGGGRVPPLPLQLCC